MKAQFKVIKADGSVEEYLHTKVIWTISRCLERVGEADIQLAEQLAEVVTYFLYHSYQQHNITSSEIFSMVKIALASSRHEEAAVSLNEFHFSRKLKRGRIEVVPVDISELDEARLLCETKGYESRSRWDKSRIAAGLVRKHKFPRRTARAIASMVEEKILGMGLTLVPVSLIKQLVWSDAAAVMQAEKQLAEA
jgi:transcriptional regulator NrdR family protein